MGSEHYCLRWNNHQSNLLGVFSQLLQDESLVDVTLACSEGASIRAHKVVLSACSSYFQSLFLDHPEKHPIVILKDVRLSELQTLVEFMYKGEVSVQYCQLSALLKTAESLKVKGLAEMTNQSAALREPERELDRLRPHSQPTSISAKSCDPPTLMDTTAHLSSTVTSGGISTNNNNNSNNSNTSNSNLNKLNIIQHQQTAANNLNTLLLKRENDRCSPSPPKRLHQSSPLPLDLYQRRCPSNNSNRRDNIDHESTGSARTTTPTRRAPSAHTNNNDDLPSPRNLDDNSHLIQIKNSSDDMDDDERNSNQIGLNMTMNPNTSNVGVSSSNIGGNNNQSLLQSMGAPPNNLPSTSTLHPMDRPSSRGGPSTSSGNGSISIGGNQITHTTTSSPSITSEPVAGPSGLGPVQSVPLSLKKEIDWERNEDKAANETMDYRQSHDSETSGSPHGLSCGGNTGTLEQSAPSVYQCVYCGATFPHQSKLTRHILSHSLETLKYREMGLLHSTGHLGNLMPHDLPPLPQHFSHRHGSLQTGQLIDSMEPPDAPNPMEIDFSAAALAAAASNLSSSILLGSSACSSGNSSMSISSTLGNQSGSASAAAAAAAAASSSSSSNDPNSVVLCKFCGKNFPDVASLITHLPAHTGDRPFKCEFCGKAFKLRHHMKDHCRVHTGERPFRCTMCGKTFSRSTILKAHEKTHYPKYVRKYLTPSPVDSKDELPQ